MAPPAASSASPLAGASPPVVAEVPIARRADASAAARATPYARHVVSARLGAARDTVRVALWRRVLAAAEYS